MKRDPIEEVWILIYPPDGSIWEASPNRKALKDTLAFHRGYDEFSREDFRGATIEGPFQRKPTLRRGIIRDVRDAFDLALEMTGSFHPDSMDAARDHLKKLLAEVIQAMKGPTHERQSERHADQGTDRASSQHRPRARVRGRARRKHEGR